MFYPSAEIILSSYLCLTGVIANKSPCPSLEGCDLNCRGGYEKEPRGCPICKCWNACQVCYIVENIMFKKNCP